MLKLDLSYNLMNREGAGFLSTCIHNIEKLDVSNCKMNEDVIELLADGLRKRSKPVKYFVQFGITYPRTSNSYLALSHLQKFSLKIAE